MLDVVPMQMCCKMDGPLTVQVDGGNGKKYTVSGLMHERSYPECTCPAYTFGKRTVNFGGRMMPKPCKHIEKAEGDLHCWHEQYSEEVQSSYQRKRGICPRCGGPTRIVMVGV